MDSKFDYRDPGTDPAYCDGLSADGPREDTECALCGAYIGHTQARMSSMRADGALPACKDCVTAELTADEFDGPTCIYCDGPILSIDDYEPYCSALCACYADRDNQEDSE